MIPFYENIVIGGGAAGFFAAITCSERSHKTLLLEKSRKVLSKVRISGGGRCNVTHSCFNPRLLVQNYPRGQLELLGPFAKFQPQDTVDWFAARGVPLKREADGRMFPTTDSSETIINCFLAEAERHQVDVWLGKEVLALQKKERFQLTLTDGSLIESDRVLLATGSNPNAYHLAESFGHTVVPPVPSLFTFNIPTSPLLDLSGISFEEVQVQLTGTTLQQTGPFLLTHWGFSGPAVLKLSSFAARYLHSQDYRAPLTINWLPHLNEEDIKNGLIQAKEKLSARAVSAEPLFRLPKNFWRRLVTLAGIEESKKWGHLSKELINRLKERLHASSFQIEGKTTYKQEFVTAGGIALSEVDFKTMQ
ncbi:MAG: hypothetical protein K0S07_1651, partial [Chlamydiales bacterium]|nr:hypothetical protein [Chlamydiales bacterium]